MKRQRPLRSNPDDFIGKVYATNNFGDVEIIAYRKAEDISVKFLRTGFERSATMADVRRGSVSDTSLSVANNKELYGVWSSMKERCENKRCHAYDSYGGRGIKVAEEFSEFWRFKLWADSNGYAAGLWLDRTDNNKGYSPDNCRWTDVRTQMRNRRIKSKFGHCIYQHPDSSRYHIRVHVNGNLHNLGTHDTVELCELIRDEFLAGVAA